LIENPCRILVRRMKQGIQFFTSLRTTIWLLGLQISMLLAGAFIMPVNEAFQSIHAVPLIQWIREQPVSVTWWMWGSIGLLTVLTANTIFCSVQSVLKKRNVFQWLLIVSPQIIHLSFLFMLIAHFASATGGFEGVVVAREGTAVVLPNNASLQIKVITIITDSHGYMRDWAVDVGYLSKENMIKEERLMPNQPFFWEGFGVYVKDLQAFPEKVVFLEISREPGAVWALIGGATFMVGIVTLLLLKMKREEQP